MAETEPKYPNLAANLCEWAQFAAHAESQKVPMPQGIHGLLARCLAAGNTALGGTTFRYIHDFLATGDEKAQAARLGVACADFGYTLAELRALRAAGKTGRDVAAEVVGRGVRRSPYG